MIIALTQRPLWILLLLLSLPLQENEGRREKAGLSLQHQQCHLHEEIFSGTCQLSHLPQQSVTARKPQPAWWFTLAESLFLLLLVKLLQL